MKKSLIMAVLIVLIATSAMAVVKGSKHDMIFSGFATGGGNTEVCAFCHTPHGAQTSLTQAPLWNQLPSANVATLYNSPTMNFTTTLAQVNATDAKLCLACHDSLVGMPVNKPNTGTITISLTTLVSANARIGTNLSNDHPIGMNLGPTPKTMDPGLRTIAQIKANFGGKTPFRGSQDDTINIMWCSSCHDVHDNTDAPFLQMNNVGSNLCKACHEK